MLEQANRPMKIYTPLGEDRLILSAVEGAEYVSALYEFRLTAVWQDAVPLNFKELLGLSVSVEIDVFNETRWINGIVKSIEQGARVREQGLTWYYLTIVPAMWLLTRRENCRIFQKKRAPDIVQEVLKDAGVRDLEVKLDGTYQEREYCVQYRETDFAFVSRLMEFEGIFYFFKHTDQGHTLVLTDDKSHFPDLTVFTDVEFEQLVGGLRVDGRIHEWVKSQEVNSGKFSLTDYNFEKPQVSLLANTPSVVSVADNATLELYENPGGYLTPSVGEGLTKIRITEEEMRAQVVHGRSCNADFRAGYKFNLKDHFSDNGKYYLTAVKHSARQPLDTGSDDFEGYVYENQFDCISFSTVYRPARVTPSPSIRGVQTAVVVGASGEEIFTDKYGRVKVQFHWDRLGKKDENSSCWIRVATYWAGSRWGAIHIPRVGQEVVVDFEEGDVDRPLIVGSVYNADLMPPYVLPDEKTKSTLKSNSSKGGGGYNELRFEDKSGKEEVYFQAQKDLVSLIKNNETREVDMNRTTAIKNNETQTVTNNETIIVEQGNQSITLKFGNQTTHVALGSISTDAMQSITLKVGPNSIVIDQMGITLKGLMINVQGSATTTIKGGMVMIN